MSFLEKKATGLRFLSLYICISIVVIAPFEASVSTVISNTRLNIIKKRAVIKRYFRYLKASFTALGKMNLPSIFLVRAVRGSEIRKNPLIKRR